MESAVRRLPEVPLPAGQKAVVLGYGLVGKACLHACLAAGVRPVAVYTHAQGADTWQEGLDAEARRLGLPCFVDVDLRDPEQIALLASWRADVLLSFYYRDVLPEAALTTARCGGLNLHGSLLPAYRGRAPVNWMVLHGETQGGATLHLMTRKPDTGPVVGAKRFPILPRDTAFDVLLKVKDAGVALVAECLGPYLAGHRSPTPQTGEPSTFGRRTPEDGRIDWARPASEIINLVRAVTRPFPGAFADLPDARRMIVWWAEEAPGHDALAPGHFSGEGLRGPEGLPARAGEHAGPSDAAEMVPSAGGPSAAGGILVGTGTVPLRLVDVSFTSADSADADSGEEGAEETDCCVFRRTRGPR
jgi:methionyl-tRNA formyltransferase